MFYCEICSDWMDCWNDCENCDVWKEKYEDEEKIPFPFQYLEQFFRGELDFKVACDNTVDEVNRLIEEYVRKKIKVNSMAQLYKMTLYVCDLEDSLSLDEIKVLIKQEALDGVAVNCLCQFADGQVGPQIEWDDDIDLNEYNCPASVWEKYFE